MTRCCLPSATAARARRVPLPNDCSREINGKTSTVNAPGPFDVDLSWGCTGRSPIQLGAFFVGHLHVRFQMYPLSTRYKAVVHYKYFCRSLRRVAACHGVSKSALHRWIHQDPKIRKQRKRSDVFAGARSCLRHALAENPFLTMHELSDILKRKCGISRSRFTTGRWRQQLGITRKKAFRTVPANATSHAVRQEFCNEYALADDGNIVCIDEAGFYVGDIPRRGYAPRGKRLNVCASKSLRRSKMTLIMAVSSVGVVHHQILDHNCRKTDFLEFMEELPVAPGTTVVMDNLACHRSAEARAIMTRKGVKPLFTPPYSPRFNAIEYVFGWMKPLYRSQCPLGAVQVEGYDFASLLEAVVASCAGLDTFFSHVRRDVSAELDAPSRSAFAGYNN